MEEFAEYNGYDGFFRTSAKTGLNVNEAMEYLINIIVKIMEFMILKGNEIIEFGNKIGKINKAPTKDKKCSFF